MKRLLVFLLLLLLGFAVLHFATGDEQLANGTAAGERTDAPRQPERTERPGGDPVIVHQDGTELSVRGGFTIAPRRSVPQPNGAVLLQPLYELTCKDCVPADAGRHRLDAVAMKLFDQGLHVADLVAARAFVELQVDPQQQRTLRENREIDLEEVILTSVAGSRLPPLRLAVARLRAVIDDEQVALSTPDEDTPVSVRVDGDQQVQVDGRGLRARLPRDRRSALGRFDLLLLHDPVVTLSGVTLRATGNLHYVEQLDLGAAMLTVENDVQVDLTGDDGAAMALARRAVTIRGERLHGWLQRTAAGGEQRRGMVWTMLRLLGSRAEVHTADLDLESPRLTIVPGPTGDVASITADSGPSELRQRGHAGATFTSPRPIHLVRTGASCAAVHRLFGFPAFALGALAEFQIVAFDGTADVDAGDDVHVAADQGLHLFRNGQAGADDGLVARGFGNVHIVRGTGADRVEARGDSGFLLSRTPQGEEIRLGRDDPAAAQTFSLARGALRFHGSGAARLARDRRDQVHVHLVSDRPTLAGDFGATDAAAIGRLRQARSLVLALHGDMVEQLVAEGDAVQLEFERGGDRLHAVGRRIEQLTAVSWRIRGGDGALARIELPPTAARGSGRIEAPHIDVHRVAPRQLLVDAVADATDPARLRAEVSTQRGATPATITATARRIRLLPFAVGPSALSPTLFGLSRPLADLVAGAIASPWLLAEDDVELLLDDPLHGELHGSARTLLANQATRSLLLQGDPAQDRSARLVRSQGGVRTTEAEGPRIRVVDAAGLQITVLPTHAEGSRLVPPQVSFRAAPAGDESTAQPRWMRGVCRGAIEVQPDAVLFHGPVTATSLTDDRQEDPDGMHITAQQLQIDRQPQTGEPTRFVAGDVTIRWRALNAHGRHIELDLRSSRCTVEDPDGAVIRFGDALTYTAPRLEANYATYSVRSYRGRLVHAAEAAAR